MALFRRVLCLVLILSLSASPAVAMSGVRQTLPAGGPPSPWSRPDVAQSAGRSIGCDHATSSTAVGGSLPARPGDASTRAVVGVRLPTRESGDLRVMADGTFRVILRIRPEAVWDDGTPVTADDFVFTHEVLTDPATVADDLSAAHAEVVPGSVTGQAKRVEFRLASPSLDWLEAFPFLLPAHALSGHDAIADWSHGRAPLLSVSIRTCRVVICCWRGTRGIGSRMRPVGRCHISPNSISFSAAHRIGGWIPSRTV